MSSAPSSRPPVARTAPPPLQPPTSSSPPVGRPGVAQRLAALPLRALVWLLGGLPLRWLHALGALVGRSRRGRVWHIVDTNLALCFPSLPAQARAALRQEVLAESGRSMFEVFRIWSRPRRALGWIRQVHGAGLLAQARAQGRGVLLLAPHLGAWELLNLHLAGTGPGSVLYRPPGSAALEQVLLRARGALGMGQIRADRNAPRSVIRALAAGGLVGILPDQQPKVGEGVFAPFFGVPALTMTLAPRLAQRTVTLLAWARRLPGSAGFDIHIHAAPAAIADPDPVVAATAMNAAIEALVRQAPEQYAWTYKRFSWAPPGAPPRYGPLTRSARHRGGD